MNYSSNLYPIVKEYDCEIAKDLFQQQHSDRYLGYHTHQLWYKYQANLMTDLHKKIIDVSYHLLTENDYHISKTHWFTETHMYNVDNKKLSTPFGWHQDNRGGWTEDNVITILYYIRKDPTVIRGNLLWTPIKKDPGDNPTSYKIIPIFTDTVIMMRGDTWHCPEDLEGTGSRDLVVVQFRSLD